MALLDKIKKFFHRLRSVDATDLAQAAKEKWLQATEDSSLSKFVPEPVGLGAHFPALPESNAAPESLRQAISHEADGILSGKWKLFRGHLITTTTPPSWHKDYLSGEENLTLQKARELDPDKMPGKMCARVVWEMNRWGQMTRLAQAFYLTGRDRYKHELVAWLENWIGMNPPGRGWNWMSARESGLRLVNLCWIDALAGLPEELLTKLVPHHVWWTQRYREPVGAGSVEALGALSGLICAAARWPKTSEWSAPLADLANELGQHVECQFGGDGAHRDQSMPQHRFALEASLHASRAMESHMLVLTETAGERLARAAAWQAELCQPHEPWMFGEGEDGSMVPLFSSADTELAEWTDWIKGHASGIRYWWGPALAPRTKVEISGHRIFRQADWLLHWDVSPQGPLPRAEFSHLDALHISLWKDGQAVLVDPGHGFPGPESHNGPHLLDGSAYPHRDAKLGWLQVHAAPVVQNQAALLRLDEKKLSRELATIEGGWRIVDEAADPFAVHWQFSPEWEAWQHGQDEFILFREGHSLTMTITGAEVELGQADCSPGFGRTCASPVLRCRAVAGGRIVTTLVATQLL